MGQKESGRQCKKCSFAWYAVQPKSNTVYKPRWFDESNPFSSNPTAGMVRRTANYDREQVAIEKWAQCPNCGSKSVKSPREQRTFQPTGRIVQSEAPAQVPQPRSSVAAQPTSAEFAPQPSTAFTPKVPATQSSSCDWEPLKRWYVRHWRLLWAGIFLVMPFGSIGDGSTYTHGAWLNVLQFVGILAASWSAAAFFFTLHRRRRKQLV